MISDKENIKSLMLYRSDFRRERDWAALCKALNVSLDTKVINLKCIVCTTISDCDDNREDYYTIAGKVQNLREWLEV